MSFQRKPATPFTEAANQSLLNQLDWGNTDDFELASRGFIGTLDDPIIRDDTGKAVWDLNAFPFLNEEAAPPSVNPSLWRQSRLNANYHGLYKVTDGVYQVRGFDLSVLTVVESNTGYIVIDTLLTAPTSKAAMELVYKHLGRKPVVAVIYTHSHVDHWGGVKGVISEEDVLAGKVRVIAPENLLKYAISENIIAGNVMSRRASYMYGNLLPTNPLGQVGAGLGQTTSSGLITLIQPTEYITATGQTLTIDGIDILFQLTPDTEAPAEMNFVFPQYQALCMAENATHNMHNLYTLRGAAVRDAKGWAQYIDDAITLFAGHYNVVFATHHWPIWGVEAGEDFLKKQRDMYKYLHDQTLRLANQGHTMHEIPDLIEFPPELGRAWFNRGYYGTVSHNVKAVYNRYLGFFDGNPATLNPLSPTEGGKKYVEFMGGAAALLEKARQSFEAGEYRWVAEVVNHLVFADPENEAARALQADALEQLGYQAESGPWRNFYLSAAKELRDGVLDLATPKAASPDTVRATPIAMFFDLLAVRLNGMKAAGKVLRFNFNLTDTNEQYTLVVENGVLNYRKDQQYADADASLITTRSALDRILMGQATAAEKLATGQAVIEGDRDKLIEFMGLLDNFEFWFNIVTP